MNTGQKVIYTMQDMSADFCASLPTEATGTLQDTRDNMIYWVAKLKDNHCWMTQDLRYAPNAPLVPPANWTEADAHVERYWNPGEYVYTTPTIPTFCERTLSLASCIDKGWLDVSNMLASNEATQTTVVDYLDDNHYIYNAHYLIGYYYSWETATNGTGKNVTEYPGEAAGSICPDGWRLPTGGADGEFAKLFSAYGDIEDVAVGGHDVRMAPFYLLYGGTVDTSRSIAVAGFRAHYWSSTKTAVNSANVLYLNEAGLHLGNFGTLDYHGFPIRCVAK